MTTLAKREEACRERRELYHERKSLGLCVNCGSAKAMAGASQCEACAKRHRGYARLSNKKRYDFFKEMGFCVRCGKKEPVKGKTLCAECASIQKEKYRQKKEGTRNEPDAAA